MSVLHAKKKEFNAPKSGPSSSFTQEAASSWLEPSQKPVSPLVRSQQFCSSSQTLLTLLLLLPSCAGPQSLASAPEPARVRALATFIIWAISTSNIYPDLITIHLLMLQRCRVGLFIVLNKHVALSKKNAHGRNMKRPRPCLNH